MPILFDFIKNLIFLPLVIAFIIFMSLVIISICIQFQKSKFTIHSVSVKSGRYRSKESLTLIKLTALRKERETLSNHNSYVKRNKACFNKNKFILDHELDQEMTKLIVKMKKKKQLSEHNFNQFAQRSVFMNNQPKSKFTLFLGSYF